MTFCFSFIYSPQVSITLAQAITLISLSLSGILYITMSTIMASMDARAMATQHGDEDFTLNLTNFELSDDAEVTLAELQVDNPLGKELREELLELDGVELEFEQEALEAIVEKAIARNTGARGLRSIIEDIMRDIMFDIPSNPKIEKCIITKETVTSKKAPTLIINENKKIEEPKKQETIKKKKAGENKTA